MIKVDRNRVAVPDIFSSEEMRIAKQRVRDFYELPKSDRGQMRFQVPFAEEIDRKIGDELFTLFNGKCAYCESSINYFEPIHIDHFRPKSGARGFNDEFAPDHYWWLMYEWSNLYLVCSTCRRYKSTWFPVKTRIDIGNAYESLLFREYPTLLDPCYDFPNKHLVFVDDGQIVPTTNRGRATIDILKLNRSELVEERGNAVSRIFKAWGYIRGVYDNGDMDKFSIYNILSEWAKIGIEGNNVPYSACKKQFIGQLLDANPDVVDSLFGLLGDDLETIDCLIKLMPVKEYYSKLLTSENVTAVNANDIGVVGHVYLDRIEFENYKCFSSLLITFDESGNRSVVSLEKNVNQEPWLLFLGENGVGKSSILKAIAIALMGDAYRKQLEDEIAPNRLLKHGTEKGYIKLFLKGEREPVEVHFERGSKAIKCSEIEAVSSLVGYGAVRLLPNKAIQPEEGDFKGVKAMNLFDYSVALADAKTWLLQLDDAAFDRAALSIKDLMLLGNNDRLERDRRREQITVVVGNGAPIIMEELSDGYKTVFALAVDIMSTLANEKVTYDLAEGIVLVDEIGTHLHPRWKMEVVKRLRKCFPRIQFIVTTHEPLCLRGLQANETVVLTRNTDKEIVALTELPDPATMQVDQLLTSEFFGLKSAIDPAIEALFEEYYSLLAIDEQQRTPAQKARLAEMHDIIPRKKHLGDNLRDELVYYVIDQLLAKKGKEGLNRESLKQEALEGVKRLWNKISANNRGKL